MTEENGTPKDLCGIATTDPDAWKQRLSSIIQQWLEPRITLAIHAVKLKDGNFAFVVRIPKSLLSPHRVIYQNRFGQFWARNSAGAYTMDTTELRRAFTLSETVFDRIRAFHQERVKQIVNGRGPVLLESHAKMIVHLIPLASFAARSNFDPKQLTAVQSNMRPMAAEGHAHRINMDGVVTHDIYDPRIASLAYVQMFRNGVLESVANEIARQLPRDPNRKAFITNYENYLLEVLPNYLACLQALSIPTPIWLFMTLTGMNNVEILTRHLRVLPPIDRENLSLPEVEISNYDQPPFSILKPLFDMIWNAAGHAESLSFDKDGNWHPTS